MEGEFFGAEGGGAAGVGADVQAPAQLLFQGDESLQLYPTKRTAFKLSPQDPAYILNMSSSRMNPGTIAASASDFTIKLYDRDSLSLTQTLRGHEGPVVGIEVSHTDPNVLWSCSQDRKVAMWDMRAGQPAIHTHIKGGFVPSCFGLSCDDTIYGVGTDLKADDANVFIFDVRNGAQPVVTFSESHSDDITHISFCPSRPTHFTSASTDGLVNIYDVGLLGEAEEPEDVILSTLNSGSSMSQVKYFGPENEYIYGISHTEQFFIWHALPIPDEESDVIASFPNIREALNEQGLPTDYVVDGVYDVESQRLFLIGGSYEGIMHISHVNLDSLTPIMGLQGGHTSTIRCVQWDFQSNSILSGGEDSMLCLWTRQRPLDVRSPSGKMTVEISKAKAKQLTSPY